MGVVPASSTDPGGEMPAGQADAPGRQDHPSTTIEPSPPSVDRFQILALDGGGAKALFTAHVAFSHIDEAVDAITRVVSLPMR